jgi:hypothetical protein
VNRHKAEILLRRQDLLLQIAAQRQGVVETAVAWAKPIRAVDSALHAGRILLSHPVLLALAGGMIMARRRNLKGLAKIAWRVWGIYRVLIPRLTGPKP